MSLCESMKNSKAQARRNAALICQQLGEKWTPKVWYNLGWYSCATNGLLEVMKEDGYFSCHYPSHAVVIGIGATPQEAVNNLILKHWRLTEAWMRSHEAILKVVPKTY